MERYTGRRYDRCEQAIPAGGAWKAVLFGYSCHATALSGYKINGDFRSTACPRQVDELVRQ